MNNRKESPKNGELYKAQITQVAGGYGLISWDSINCMNPLQTVVWLKICETAFKTANADGRVTVNEQWLNRNFKDVTEWRDAILAIFELEHIGFISCSVYKSSIVLIIEWEQINSIIQIIGRERGAGIRIIESANGKRLMEMGALEIGKLRLPKTPYKDGRSVISEILDELCK